MPYPLAARYTQFLDAVFGGLAEPTSPSWPGAFSELDLQSLWFSGEFGHSFLTTCGQQVTIRDFGIWNHSAGPDFIQTCVQIGDKTWRGAIELDPDARDWERHGHGSNADYNHVVLHLFTQTPLARFYTRNSEHREIVQVHLQPEMLAANAVPRRQAEAHLGRCFTPLASMQDAKIHSLIEAAAEHRLERKSARLQTLIAIHGRDQAIYQTLAAILGYRPNQRAFTILAQRLPLKLLLKKPRNERESLLFGVAGHLEPIKDEDTSPDTRLYLKTLWSEWWKRRHAFLTWLEPATLPPWQNTSSRPGNHPQRRLGALVSILGSWRPITAPLRNREWDLKKFCDALASLDHPYWSHHYTLLSKPIVRPMALLGKTRIREILANLVYPLLIPDQPELGDEYLQLSAALDNHKVRRAALRLFGNDPRSAAFQKRLHQQQGLLQLYEDFCLEDHSACSECPFPERLREWS
ncbi:DUF2851 family protein [Phragmitibacter flavus]|nr:DUF2851 family protein [Phragmitibacter flavus]